MPEIRCLYCDGKLPLFRKLTNGQFCSAGHRKAYWDEQERLAVERLHQTHDSLMAYRASVPAEPEIHEVSPSAPLPTESYYTEPERPAAPRYYEEISAEEARKMRSAANRGEVRVAGFLAEAKPPAHAGAFTLWIESSFTPWTGGGLSIPSCGLGPLAGGVDNAIAVPMPWQSCVVPSPATQIRVAAGKDEPIALLSKTTPRLALAAPVETPELEQALEAALLQAEEPVVETEEVLLLADTLAPAEELPVAPVEPSVIAEPEAQAFTPVEQEIAASSAPAEPAYPMAESLMALPQIGPRDVAVTLRASDAGQWKNVQVGQLTPQSGPVLADMLVPAGGPLALTFHLKPVRAALGDRVGAPSAVEFKVQVDAPQIAATAALAPSLRLAIGRREPVSSPVPVTSVRPVDVRADVTASPSMDSCTHDVEPALSLAPGCRYPLMAGNHAMSVRNAGVVEPIATKPSYEIVALPAGLGDVTRQLAFPAMRPLKFAMEARRPAAAQTLLSTAANEYPESKPLLPIYRPEPIEGELAPVMRPGRLAVWAQALKHSGDGANILTHAADFWKNAPRDLKMLVVAIPILLGLALRPSLPKVHVSAPAVRTQIPSSFSDSIHAQFVNVRRTVASRAAVALNEEFRSGLDDWQSKGGVATAWSYDNTGFVRPGSLALYRPSMGLTNYEVQFLGLIDKKALSWVARAADFDNYYVVKLVVLKPGPIPTIGITRYAVIDGKAQDRKDTVAPINARPDMLYRVGLDVNGDTFLLTLQGSVVDTWTEPRLKSGGIGFFAPRGEESRVRWVQVTHQYDMLGRLCAFLAPYNISNTDGSW